MAQWLRLHAFTAAGPGSIPNGELRSCKLWGAAKKRKEKNRNSFLNKVKKIFKINKETKVAHVKGVSRRRKAENTIPESITGITLARDRGGIKINSTVLTSGTRRNAGFPSSQFHSILNHRRCCCFSGT